MKKPQKRVLPFLVLVAIIIAFGVILFTHSSYYQSVESSKELVKAILENDYDAATEVLSDNPDCINTLPSFSPWWWRLMTEHPSVIFPLQQACYMGDFKMVKLMLDYGAEVNLVPPGIEGSQPPLTCAVISGSPESAEIISLLLESGADKSLADHGGRTALDYAVELSHTELIELLNFTGLQAVIGDT